MRRLRGSSGREEPGSKQPHRAIALNASMRSTSAFEILYGALVLLSLVARVEGSQVSPFAGLRVLLPRIQSVLAVLEFSDHRPVVTCLVVTGFRLFDRLCVQQRIITPTGIP